MKFKTKYATIKLTLILTFCKNYELYNVLHRNVYRHKDNNCAPNTFLSLLYRKGMNELIIKHFIKIVQHKKNSA